MRAAVLLALLLAAAPHAGADVVTLSNGAKIEGVVEKETDTEVTVKTPEGRLRLNRTRVRSVERAAAGAVARAAPAAIGLQTPREFEGTWTELAALDTQKTEMSRAEKRLGEIETRAVGAAERLRALNDGLNAKTEALTDLEKRIAAAKGAPGQEKAVESLTRQFNALMKAGMTERDEFATLQRTLNQDRESAQKLSKGVSEYARRLETFLADYLARKAGYAKAHPGEHAEFFTRVEERLRRHVKAPVIHEIALQKKEEDLLLPLTIGSANLRLQVQTGISHLVLGAPAAKRLKLTPTGQQATVRLSEGGTLECQALPPASARAGTLTLTALPCVLAPEPLPGFDGIFGLGLLRDTFFRLDRDQAKLVVIELPTAP